LDIQHVNRWTVLSYVVEIWEMERKSGNREDGRKISKMGLGSGCKNAGILGDGGIGKRKVR